MERAARMSGARFGYWVGDTALLALALYRLALDRLAAKGFVTVLPPVLVREEALIGTGAFPVRRAERLRARRRRALPRRHGRDPARRACTPARSLDGGRAAAPLRRLLAVLPARGGRRRPRHARDDPRPPVQQGRAVLVHAARGLVGRARVPAREHRGARAGARAARTASSSSRPATSRPRRRRPTTSRSGSRARIATARRPRSRTRPTSRRGGSGSATAANGAPSRCTR